MKSIMVMYLFVDRFPCGLHVNVKQNTKITLIPFFCYFNTKLHPLVKICKWQNKLNLSPAYNFCACFTKWHTLAGWISTIKAGKWKRKTVSAGKYGLLTEISIQYISHIYMRALMHHKANSRKQSVPKQT